MDFFEPKDPGELFHEVQHIYCGENPCMQCFGPKFVQCVQTLGTAYKFLPQPMLQRYCAVLAAQHVGEN